MTTSFLFQIINEAMNDYTFILMLKINKILILIFLKARHTISLNAQN